MNRRQRRRAKRLGPSAAEVQTIEVEMIVAATIGTVGRVADELEAGRLDPGTHGRAEFITTVRNLQQRIGDDPTVLAQLVEMYADPAGGRARLAAQGPGKDQS